jgi:hypothetical protein
MNSDPKCRVYVTGSVVWSNNALNVVAFDANHYDSGLHDTTTNPERLVPTKTGVYVVGTVAAFGANATGQRQVRIIKVTGNGSTRSLVGLSSHPTPSGTNASYLQTNCDIHLVADGTEWIEIEGFQNSGGNITVGRAADYQPCEAWMRWTGYTP